MSSQELISLNNEIEEVLNFGVGTRSDHLIRALRDKLKRLVDEKILLEKKLAEQNDQLRHLSRIASLRDFLNVNFPSRVQCNPMDYIKNALGGCE